MSAAESSPILGQMMDYPLLVSSLLRHAERNHGDTEIVSRCVDGSLHRYTYAEAAARARQLARALEVFGLEPGQRVGTLAWNTYRHFELYYGISGLGGVVHTINPRLLSDQVAWIVNHADDQLLFFDSAFAPVIEAIAKKCPGVRYWVAMCDRDAVPEIKGCRVVCYEDFIATQSSNYQWPELDERQAAALCYTSGTTGDPKGVLYSHRSLLLHTFSACLPDCFGVSASDVVLPVVPMFHVNAWSIPYVAAMVGTKLVLPGAQLDGASLYELFENESVTLGAGVPTVWLALLDYLRANDLRLSNLRRLTVGGSACPPSLMRGYLEEHGVQLEHAWGMTESSPLGTYNQIKGKHLGLGEEELEKVRLNQGRPPFGIELQTVDSNGDPLPADGRSAGDLMMRGAWVVQSYFRQEGSALVDGWFPTGDVGSIDSDGYLTITDRTKDMIKSGGEWISSIALENIAMSHPAVASAAVIAAKHEKWDERPLLLVVAKPEQEVSKEELLGHFAGQVATWWVPDDVVLVDALPLGATGKVQKNRLRDMFSDHLLVARELG